MDSGAGIELAAPNTIFVVKKAGVPAIVRQRASAVRTQEAATKLADGHVLRTTRYQLDHRAIDIRAIKRRGKSSPIAVPQSVRIEDVYHLVIDAFLNEPTQVLERRVDIQDRASSRVTLHLVHKVTNKRLGNNDLWI